MLSSLKTLLLLSVLCPPSSCLCLRLARGRSDLLCDNQMAAGGRFSSENVWGSLLQSSAEYLGASASEESSSREKRTFNPAKSRFQSRAKLRGSLLRNGGKEERRSQLTLSLDLPTNIMNVIFEMAKDQNLRSKADENARLLARIGRRK
ncbi:urocortin 3, like [Hippocampus comes]|uniref:Urocortin 3, like n=1 Tax=Hippocampus comes TaxID=109280 RepID=A0A3Q2XFX6_HIPCM|nr:PREDICTED: urocortin-3-like [Hippocampus comes]XP_019738751.1 PREDICTED: urocortin-3-like [Hippocampus comes]